MTPHLLAIDGARPKPDLASAQNNISKYRADYHCSFRKYFEALSETKRSMRWVTLLTAPETEERHMEHCKNSSHANCRKDSQAYSANLLLFILVLYLRSHLRILSSQITEKYRQLDGAKYELRKNELASLLWMCPWTLDSLLGRAGRIHRGEEERMEETGAPEPPPINSIADKIIEVLEKYFQKSALTLERGAFTNNVLGMLRTRMMRGKLWVNDPWWPDYNSQ